MADMEDMLKRLEKDKTLLYFGGLKRIAEDVEEAAELLKSQKAEIAELKAEKHKPNCSSAEHNPSTGKCYGYGRNENDDEPIDACKVCERYDSYGIE